MHWAAGVRWGAVLMSLHVSVQIMYLLRKVSWDEGVGRGYK